MDQRITRAMGDLGFTASEAKVYLVLLRGHPATGYELAARSGVPRSAIYNILKKLEGAGLVNAIQDKPTRYIPLPPERLYQLLEARFARSLEALRSSMAGLLRPADTSSIWHIQGYQQLVENGIGLVRRAKESVFASLWRREADQLAESFKKAVARGVNVVLFSFTELPPGIGRVFSYGLAEPELERHWAHKLILISDRSTVLVGGADTTDDNRATVTDDSTIVEMSLNNLVLDLTLYGQRFKVDTGDVVPALNEHMAPIDELLQQGHSPLRKPAT